MIRVLGLITAICLLVFIMTVGRNILDSSSPASEEGISKVSEKVVGKASTQTIAKKSALNELKRKVTSVAPKVRTAMKKGAFRPREDSKMRNEAAKKNGTSLGDSDSASYAHDEAWDKEKWSSLRDADMTLMRAAQRLKD